MAFYSEKHQKDENIGDYDAVLFTVCDLFGRPRGKFAVGNGIHTFSNHGMEIPHAICVLGFHSETPLSIPRYNRTDAVTCKLYPDLKTLQPLSWLCTEHRKVGHVLCDLYDKEGQLNMFSPRAIALKQLNDLRELGFEIMTAFEAEYIVYHKGTLKPYGGEAKEVANMWRLDTNTTFYYNHMMDLLASGIPVETQMEESAQGQIEYSMKPLYGITMADSVHRLRYVTKSICERNGLEPTFMSRSKYEKSNSGFHLNHSLWTLDGKNAFYDPDSEHNCSDIMYHWIAGLIHHGNALTALMNPTVNCYERLHNHFTPSDNIWNYSDRNARLRVKTKGINIHIEERMPSSACNPYLTLAGLIAAGIDGIVRKLEVPPPRTYRPKMSGDERATVQNPLPGTLGEALNALEQDHILTKALGEDFVQEYVALCKEFQLEKLKDIMEKDPKERFEAERDFYLQSL